MKILVLDVVGRNPIQYNPALCNALSKSIEDVSVTLMSPTHHGSTDSNYYYRHIVKLVPDSKAGSSSKIKLILRATEAFINYIYVLLYVFVKKPDVLHIQWLPFLEIANIESLFISLIHAFSRKTKIAFTAHNIYPHDISNEKKRRYRVRFCKISKKIDVFLVHLQSSKTMFCNEFNINPNKVFIAYHGIFVPENYVPENSKNDGVFRIIMYGSQTYYKGTDLFIEALSRINKNKRAKIDALIVGRTDTNLYDEYQEHASSMNVKWINRFVTDEELYEAIGKSNLILLPYRTISQSGVLLLALSYKKSILTSDLPSFKETLEGYSEDMFFESEKPQSLANIIERYVDGKIDLINQKEVIENLNNKYSWSETGKQTLKAYSSVCKIKV